MERQDIEEVLLNLGMPAGIKGFKYIPEVVMLLDDGWDKVSMNRVYLKVGTTYGDKMQNVERTIRHALSVIRERGDKESVNLYLGKYGNNKNTLHHLCYVLRNDTSKGGVA